jgi:ABC-type phosphate transport system permease subunit
VIAMQKSSTPFWETAILGGSFVLLWVWFLSFKNAERANEILPLWWHALLLLAVVLLIWVFARRIKRLQRALRGEDENGNATPIYPVFVAPPRDDK